MAKRELIVAPEWARNISVDQLKTILRDLPSPAHTQSNYEFPPAHMADVYGRGDPAPRVKAETPLSSVLLIVLEHRGLPHVVLTRRSGSISHGLCVFLSCSRA